jgi:uncharacterized protein (DUF4213/DUF364 family)
MLADDILKQLRVTAAKRHAADIRIGLGYTAVRLDDGRCGLAFTLHEEEYESCCVVPEAGTLTGRSVMELAEYMKSPDTIACAIGLAAANAAIDPPAAAVESDILDVLALKPDDSVGMIGYFGPLVEPVRQRAGELHIFERRPIPDLGVLPDTAAGDFLPECQVVIMSATTLLNHTIDALLDYCRAAREIALLGPSTPFLPEVFGRRGVTILSGLQVVDAPQILRIVSEGGGTRQFGSAVRKLSLSNLTREQSS